MQLEPTPVHPNAEISKFQNFTRLDVSPKQEYNIALEKQFGENLNDKRKQFGN
jgi:hypothetical protein